MSGLTGSREYVLRTEAGEPLLTFRQSHTGDPHPVALVIVVHDEATRPQSAFLGVSSLAVEDLHAIIGEILSGHLKPRVVNWSPML